MVYRIELIEDLQQVRKPLARDHLSDKADSAAIRIRRSPPLGEFTHHQVNFFKVNTIANKTGSGGRNTKARHILNQLFRERHHLIKIPQHKGSNLYKSTKLEPHLPGKPVWCAHALYSGAAGGNQAEDVRFITMGVDDVDVPFTNHPA